MVLFPKLEIGWLNGWIPLAFEFLSQGTLLLIFPKDVVSRLFDRSGWGVKQRAFTIIGKLFSFACLFLIIFTPLKFTLPTFIAGGALYVIGLAGLVLAMLDFKNTPLGQPAITGIYKLSRHPQIVALFSFLLGICLMIGSWAALFTLILSKAFKHLGIFAEEEACLKQYGESYRIYMKKIPRYFLFF
jgi:protein-S-isoprenylcysteine O-methyltransferase Ste14